VNHIALDRSRPDDRHPDDEAIKCLWFQARQHRHLGAAFDLEGANRVSLPDHGIGCMVLPFDRRKIKVSPLCSRMRSKAFAMQVSMPRAKK
jgi:hypothetical protein